MALYHIWTSIVASLMMILVGCLVVFYVPSTARSFRDSTAIYCPLQSTWSSVFTPFPPGIEPWAVAWQSFTLPLHLVTVTPAPWYWTRSRKCVWYIIDITKYMFLSWMICIRIRICHRLYLLWNTAFMMHLHTVYSWLQHQMNSILSCFLMQKPKICPIWTWIRQKAIVQCCWFPNAACFLTELTS